MLALLLAGCGAGGVLGTCDVSVGVGAAGVAYVETVLAGESRSAGLAVVFGVLKRGGVGVTLFGLIGACWALGLCGIRGVELWLTCLAGVWIVTSWNPDPASEPDLDLEPFPEGVVRWSKIESPLDWGVPK